MYRRELCGCIATLHDTTAQNSYRSLRHSIVLIRGDSLLCLFKLLSFPRRHLFRQYILYYQREFLDILHTIILNDASTLLFHRRLHGTFLPWHLLQGIPPTQAFLGASATPGMIFIALWCRVKVIHFRPIVDLAIVEFLLFLAIPKLWFLGS